MDNSKHTTAIGSDGFKRWVNDIIENFNDHDSDFDSTFKDGVVKINYKNEYDQCGNNKAILICTYGNGSNLWNIIFDSKLVDLEPSEILSFRDYK